MCPKTPKVPETKEKKPQYLRNPYLDGPGIGGENIGRNSLRIDTAPGSLPETPPQQIGFAKPPEMTLSQLTRNVNTSARGRLTL